MQHPHTAAAVPHHMQPLGASYTAASTRLLRQQQQRRTHHGVCQLAHHLALAGVHVLASLNHLCTADEAVAHA